MPPVGFEPAISAHEGPLTHALDRAASGTGCIHTRRQLAIEGLGRGVVGVGVISRSNRMLTEHSTCTRHVLGVQV
jgi:hypothetical protein